LRRDRIKEMKRAEKSIMPEGLERAMSDGNPRPARVPAELEVGISRRTGLEVVSHL